MAVQGGWGGGGIGIGQSRVWSRESGGGGVEYGVESREYGGGTDHLG